MSLKVQICSFKDTEISINMQREKFQASLDSLYFTEDRHARFWTDRYKIS